MWCQIILLCLLLAESMSYRTRRGEPLASSKSKSFDLLMPGALPLNDDSYLCSSFSVASVSLSSSIYVTEFLPNADAARAHHMLLYACEEPVRKPGVVYDCLHHQVCNTSSSIMFAWAKNAPPKKLPQDVSFEVSPDQKGYLVLQVHYKHPLATPDQTGLSLKYSTQATTYTAGILLMLRGYLTIPPNTEATHGDVNCQLPSSNPLHFFAYRTHAHSLGSVITGYVYNANKSSYHEIARGNPQWPQAFYPMKQVETVHPGEILAARCTYNTLGHNTTTRIGSTGGDEMCNLYLMFYAKPGDAPDNFIMCMNEQVGKAITDNLPEDSDTPLPPNPLLEEHSSNKDSKGNLYKLFQNELESGTSKKKVLEDPDSDSSFTEMFQQELDTGTSRKKVLEDPSGEGTDFSNGAENELLVEQKKSGAGPTVRKRPGVDMDQDEVAATTTARDGKAFSSSSMSAVPNWPVKETADRLGQVSGVSIDIYGNPVVFHRGDRMWNGATFKNDNTYGGDRNNPIQADTVLTLDGSGKVIHSWGSQLFFMPHMVTVDSKNNIWLTDVARHQVFKFPPYGGNHQPLIELGEKFVPGGDDNHYCKPTSVAVSEDTNTFFVSDGYCNSRIIKYSVSVDAKTGKHVVNKELEWGRVMPFTMAMRPDSFNVPHGLALAEEKNQVCVADRENGRVQCFSSVDGSFVQSVKPPEFGSRIFSVAYSSNNGGKLYAVSGPEFSLNPLSSGPTGYCVDLASNRLESTWNVPGGLKNPHDIAVSANGSTIYAVELNPFLVWKLTDGSSNSPPPPPTTSAPIKTPVVTSSSPLETSVSKLKLSVPLPEMSGSMVIATTASLILSLLVICCLAIRKCRKKGKGTAGSKNRGKQWDTGDILGRNKEGFQPLNTDDRDGDYDCDSDSEVEEFSVPAMHA